MPPPSRLPAAGCLLAAMVLVAGCGSGGGEPRPGTQPSTASGRPAPRAGLSPAQQVGQAVILSFDGPSVPDYVERALREGRVAGVILFSDNVVSADQLRALTARLQRAARGSALVMVDQEGGPVRIVPFAAPAAGQATQGTAEEAREAARSGARDLRRLGVNVNLAPVADLPTIPGAALAGRSFTGDAATVASRVREAVRGLRSARMGATAKHFPGLGGATVNTDDAPATIPEFQTTELEPFRAAVRAGAPLVMASHGLYPQLDPAHIASQSPTILQGLLRRRLGFDGVIVTDSMEAEAVVSRSSITRASEAALLAGVDLLLLTGNGSFRPVSLHLRSQARRSPRLRARLRESNRRVAALKVQLGLRPYTPSRRAGAR